MKHKYYLFILVVLVGIGLCVTPVNAWLAGYSYEKDVIINSTYPVTLTNYQKQIYFHNSSGTDGAYDCYLNGHITQPSTWNDLRVTDINDNICSLWIQSINATATVVWVKLPYLYTGFNTFHIYYGKDDATSVTDGDATFRFYGTFQYVPLNVDKWIGVGNYTQYIDGNGNNVVDIKENATSGVSYVTSQDQFSYASGYQSDAAATMPVYPPALIGLYYDSSTYAYFGASQGVNNSYTAEVRNKTGTTGTTVINLGSTYTGWHIWTIRRNQLGNSAVFLIDNVQVANITTNVPTGNMPLMFRSTAVGGNPIINWTFIRRYVTPNPLIYSYGTETVQGSPTSNFEASPRFGNAPLPVFFTDISTGVVSSWSWTFGDGHTSTSQNPNNTYINPGSYNVSLTTTNSNGSNIKTQYDFILVTSNVTPTPTVTSNLSNVTYIEETDQAYVPSIFYFLLVALAFIFFILSVMVRQSDDINGILAAVFFAIVAMLTASVEFVSVGFTSDITNTTAYIVPVAYHPYVPYISWMWVMMFLVAIINIYRIWSRNLKESAAKQKAERGY